ncbi:MAG TPA: hypothetical protein VE954_35175 [Oligoflexus sp.]|uniref:hypothetical protein n=1 Tax=Oligoflexus sp. TaxID=1971216 RepID=UPI002D3EAFD3|nr:hypothetical protein [Oligoflexus sp.]HYX38375.1 hypothetical protein [Oligoflexus sp.]
MDEQNARVLAALQTTIGNAKADQKREQERLLQTMSLLHHTNLEAHRKITENCLAAARKLALEANAAKQYAWIAAGVGVAFGILVFCANLYLIFWQ